MWRYNPVKNLLTDRGMIAICRTVLANDVLMSLAERRLILNTRTLQYGKVRCMSSAFHLSSPSRCSVHPPTFLSWAAAAQVNAKATTRQTASALRLVSEARTLLASAVTVPWSGAVFQIGMRKVVELLYQDNTAIPFQ